MAQRSSLEQLRNVTEADYVVILEGETFDGLYQNKGGDWQILSHTSINLAWFEEDFKVTALKRVLAINKSKDLGYAVYFGDTNLVISEYLVCDRQVFWGGGKICPDASQNDFALNVSGDHNVFLDLVFEEKTFCKVLLEVNGNHNRVENCQFLKARKSTSTRVIYSDRFLNISNRKGKGNRVLSCKFDNGRIGVALEGNYQIRDCEVSNCIMGLLLRPSSIGSEICHNLIKDNNVNHKSGADGILAQRNVTQLHIHHNTILNSGEHGIYFQGDNSVLEKNIVQDNFKSGIKLASYNTNLYPHEGMAPRFYVGHANKILNNSCENNCRDTKDQSNAGIYLQAPLINIQTKGNFCSNNTYGIRSTSLAKLKPEEFDTKAQLRDLIFDGNEAFNTKKSSFYIEGETGIVIQNNRMDSLLTNAKSTKHRIQAVLVKGNLIQEVLVLNRAEKAQITNNSIGKISIISNSQGREHRIESNKDLQSTN
ncbi:MAG: right-handed parallel beta-helix repeat-containing protein [Lunatimonas sp.]|uniref:right-handed parallel beta-helix repeat-containing protein n=1 Tax=Lunatimonas sp. TaxID=2060141 RepID=UPI002A49DB2E|nr:right-handed parallel beta-helix repeat-containing protein [Lunatimonas sp.]